MENLEIYERVRSVPKEALKAFDNGRFKGTDINPMWRIKTLTELFGPAGIGWYYEVLSERSETHGNVVIAVVDINLYVKIGGEWSKPIYGTGGNQIMTNKGFVSDEGYKMALTDAISVACKALGIGADVWFANDRTKYDSPQETPQNVPQRPTARPNVDTDPMICVDCGAAINMAVRNYSVQRFGRPLCRDCQKRA